MERDSARNRKRTRDGEDETAKNKESRPGKKQERGNNSSDDKWYDSCDGIGVFDFPWLKEGVVFKTDDYLDDHDEKFSPCSYPDAFAASFDQSRAEDLGVSPGPDADLHDGKYDDDSFSSLLVDDDLEKVDCIWSCVIDQPLEFGFKKGCIDKL